MSTGPQTYVRCTACGTKVRLSPAQVEELRRSLRVRVRACPSCQAEFIFEALSSRRISPPPAAEADSVYFPPEANPTAPPAAAADEPPVFQPVPPSAGSGPGLASTDQPAFQPINPTAPAASAGVPAPRPHFAPIPPGGMPARPAESTPEPLAAPRPRRSLNERWKSLPQWLQWTVVIVLVALIAVTIFLLPI